MHINKRISNGTDIQWASLLLQCNFWLTSRHSVEGPPKYSRTADVGNS